MRDLKNNLAATQSIAPAARTATVNGDWVDLLGADGAMVVFDIGLFTNGTFTPVVQEADNDDKSDAADVAAADLEGSLTDIDSTDDDNTVQRVGYKGNKRYIRARMVQSASPAPGTGLVHGATVITNPLVRPAA